MAIEILSRQGLAVFGLRGSRLRVERVLGWGELGFRVWGGVGGVSGFTGFGASRVSGMKGRTVT